MLHFSVSFGPCHLLPVVELLSHPTPVSSPYPSPLPLPASPPPTPHVPGEEVREGWGSWALCGLLGERGEEAAAIWALTSTWPFSSDS